MHNTVNITENIYWLGVNDRKTERFENMWPLPYGVSYNSYLIVDEKVVLVDTLEYGSSDDYLDKIEEFRPEGMASRILGMGDVVGLVQDFEDVVDAEKAREISRQDRNDKKHVIPTAVEESKTPAYQQAGLDYAQDDNKSYA